MNMLAFGAPGPSEWVLILIIVLVLFGAKKLPELARSLGQSMNEFRKAREDFDKELHAAGSEVKSVVQPSYQPAPNQQPYQAPQNPPPANQPVAQQNPPPQQPTQPS
jgi:sec-independent protein translocase protein TatA